MKKNELSLRDPGDTTKHTNMHIIGVSEERKKRAEKKFEEIMAVKFSNLMKNINLYKSKELNKEQ